LAFAAEQIGQRLLAAWRVEQVIFIDLLPRQLAPLAAQRIAGAAKGFLLGEIGFARRDPFIMRNDFCAVP